MKTVGNLAIALAVGLGAVLLWQWISPHLSAGGPLDTVNSLVNEAHAAVQKTVPYGQSNVPQPPGPPGAAGNQPVRAR